MSTESKHPEPLATLRRLRYGGSRRYYTHLELAQMTGVPPEECRRILNTARLEGLVSVRRISSERRGADWAYRWGGREKSYVSSLSLPRSTYKALREYAEREGATVNELLRRMIEEALRAGGRGLGRGEAQPQESGSSDGRVA
jgi:hypothetical protein